MADRCVWTGASRTPYTYFVYPVSHRFAPNEVGNYIYARLADNAYHPIYIGEGELADRCSDQHHQAKQIASKGATHVHAHLNSVEAARKAEENDLLSVYTEAYAPIGCNEKLGG